MEHRGGRIVCKRDEKRESMLSSHVPEISGNAPVNTRVRTARQAKIETQPNAGENPEGGNRE
jgi:hypothetical protein